MREKVAVGEICGKRGAHSCVKCCSSKERRQNRNLVLLIPGKAPQAPGQLLCHDKLKLGLFFCL